MGSQSRTRTQSVPNYPKSYYLGASTTERFNTLLDKWVFSSRTPVSYSMPTTRAWSSLRRCVDALHWPGPPYHEGGPLDITYGCDGGLRTVPLSSNGWVYTSDVVRTRFEGSMMPAWVPPAPYTLRASTTLDSMGFPDLSSFGPGAYQKYSPTKPAVSMGQFFAEFKEIPQMFQQTAKFFRDDFVSKGGKKHRWTKKLSDEYLNNQFGWVPFLGSIIDFNHVMKTLHERFQRLKNYNGKWEHRGGPVNEDLEEQVVYDSNTTSLLRPSLSSAFGNQGSVKVTKRTYREVWFSAEYKYYIPPIKFQSIWSQSILRQILGLRITPSLLWEVTPFSWLFDWFGNIGDILANCDDAEMFNLVSRNAYLMAKTNVDFVLEGTRFCGGQRHYGRWLYEYGRKQRVKASPYGFSVQFNDLSEWQVSILAALRMSFTK